MNDPITEKALFHSVSEAIRASLASQYGLENAYVKVVQAADENSLDVTVSVDDKDYDFQTAKPTDFDQIEDQVGFPTEALAMLGVKQYTMKVSNLDDVESFHKVVTAGVQRAKQLVLAKLFSKQPVLSADGRQYDKRFAAVLLDHITLASEEAIEDVTPKKTASKKIASLKVGDKVVVVKAIPPIIDKGMEGTVGRITHSSIWVNFGGNIGEAEVLESEIRLASKKTAAKPEPVESYVPRRLHEGALIDDIVAEVITQYGYDPSKARDVVEELEKKKDEGGWHATFDEGNE